VFINKLWKTGQISTNTGFVIVFSTFFHVVLWIPWREEKITNTQCVNNGDFGGKHRFLTVKIVNVWVAKRFGKWGFYPIYGMKKSYPWCFQQGYIFTKAYSYPQGIITHNVKNKLI
jgi:hypothetical protein